MFILDVSHELLPKDYGTNAPAIVIHTCDDSNNPAEINNALRQKLIKPNLVQTKRPPRNENAWWTYLSKNKKIFDLIYNILSPINKMYIHIYKLHWLFLINICAIIS